MSKRGYAATRAWNVDGVVVHMQRDLRDLEMPGNPPGITVRQANPDTDDGLWRDLVARSYPDEELVPSLAQHIAEHRFLDVLDVWIIEADQGPVATITLGCFRDDPAVAGVARIAVLPKARRQGLGTWMVTAAYARLRDLGCEHGESVIRVTRTQSLRMHAQLGWRLQDDWSKVHSVGQYRRPPARQLALRRARQALRPTRTDYRGKRTFDLITAASALVLASPVLAVAALAVRRDSPGPVFFRDARIGRDRQPFLLWKFRTMYVAEPGERRSAASITRTGHWLRRWSIDELPQLFNVVRGDMSLVGPRPLAQRQLVGLRPEHEARFDVKPGLTGLAQVNGRNAIPRVKRWDYDVEYATTASLRLDLAIVARTARVVLTGAGSDFPEVGIQNQGLFDQ